MRISISSLRFLAFPGANSAASHLFFAALCGVWRISTVTLAQRTQANHVVSLIHHVGIEFFHREGDLSFPQYRQKGYCGQIFFYLEKAMCSTTLID